MIDNYRIYLAWKEAIDLSKRVHGLIESLPSDEQSGLAASLNTVSVAIPTQIALDIMHQRPADLTGVVGLQTQIELINQIYPALDTAEVEHAAANLLTRLQQPDRFNETPPALVIETTDEPDTTDDTDDSDTSDASDASDASGASVASDVSVVAE